MNLTERIERLEKRIDKLQKTIDIKIAGSGASTTMVTFTKLIIDSSYTLIGTQA